MIGSLFLVTEMVDGGAKMRSVQVLLRCERLSGWIRTTPTCDFGFRVEVDRVKLNG